jgi:hypothetical protein
MIAVLATMAAAIQALPPAPINSHFTCEMVPGKMPGAGTPARPSPASLAALPKQWRIQVSTPEAGSDAVTYFDPVIGKSLNLKYKWLAPANYGGSGFSDGKDKGERWTVYYSVLQTEPGEALVSIEYTHVRRKAAGELVQPLSAHGRCHETVSIQRAAS